MNKKNKKNFKEKNSLGFPTSKKNSVGNKKAISAMIGYILLISFAVVMGVIVFAWLKTYVPRDSLECSEGTSLFIKDYEYNCTLNQLTLTVLNNGRFNVGGYFIKASNSSEHVLATNDLSGFVMGDKTKLLVGNIIRFSGGGDNSFEPGDAPELHGFNLSSSGLGQIKSIEITPVRWQTEENKKNVVSCGDAKVKELISCS